jgi:very-short-patch-repair endonuclease
MFEHASHPKSAVARARRLRSAMTCSEQRLWRELKKLDAHIRRQAPIGNYIVDFVCHAKRLIVEVDGEIHERLDEVALRDHERAEWLRGQGYRVVRFANRQVEADVFAVTDEVRRLLALPPDREGLGWGASPEAKDGPGVAQTPSDALRPNALLTPPSPTLPPSRRKGQ